MSAALTFLAAVVFVLVMGALAAVVISVVVLVVELLCDVTGSRIPGFLAFAVLVGAVAYQLTNDPGSRPASKSTASIPGTCVGVAP